MDFALLLLSLFLLTTRAQSQLQQLEAVRDTEGNPLVGGEQYRVMPADNSNGGGLRMAKVNGSCPLNILLDKRIRQPVMFFRGLNPGGVIRLGMGLYILFPRPSPCSDSTMWMVNNGYITTGGGASDTSFPGSRFAIVSSGGAYQIETVCNICTPTGACTLLPCEKVVPKDVDGRLLLGTSLFEGYAVVFERVKKPATTVVSDA